MKIKSVKLSNIRSYLSEEIKFPSGSVLLSGDIGTGKSSILQAIEFALFGILRSELSGASLLRKGKNSGYVELNFSVEGKEITIKRILKRERTSVGQDSGILVIDGKRYELTANELKAKILEILGYPEELVTKSKSLIYRYTVYTPQEEMKRILFEDKETRLDTLRRLFEIEKYRRVAANSEIVVRRIKEIKKCYSGMVFDLNDKLRQRKLFEKELNAAKEKADSIVPAFNAVKESILRKKEALARIEEEIKKLNELKKKEAIVSERALLLEKELTDKKNEVSTLSNELCLLEKELAQTASEDLKFDKDKIEKRIKDAENTLLELNRKLSELEYAKRFSLETKENIIKMKICPTCMQHVSESHKHSIITKEESKLNATSKQIIEFSEERKEWQSRLDSAKAELKRIVDCEKILEKRRFLAKELEEKRSKKETISNRIRELEKELDGHKETLEAIKKEFALLKDVEERFGSVKKELDSAINEEREIELKKLAYEKESEGIQKQLNALNAEIEKKQIYSKRIELLEKTKDWIEVNFVSLVKLIEKHVMYRIYMEFNELFQKWVNILLEDENLNIKLDEEFSPLIEQNGYEVDISDLSGGEKTACALAYRLALNRVINNLMSFIKTKDIIILDEPTDGFSSEQLDKVRDILEQLRTSQTILVSHEAKLESFVEHIIRISKTGHVSRVISA